MKTFKLTLILLIMLCLMNCHQDKHNNSIDIKIDELIELAKKEEDFNMASMMLIIKGARVINMDEILGDEMRKYTEEVLLPFLNNEIQSSNIKIIEL